MSIKNNFENYNPTVCFAYFCSVMAFPMFCMHPLCLLISFAFSVLYYLKIYGTDSVSRITKIITPVFLFTVTLNMLFSHNGKTVLFRIYKNLPVTLESMLYGIASAFMLTAVLIWFFCLSETLTSDKLMYMFGRFAPSTALLLSTTLRFIPTFKTRFEAIRQAQSSLGRDFSDKKIFSRVKTATEYFSVLVTWSTENAIDTSDSMKARGFGLKKRTDYSRYTFCFRDAVALSTVICLTVLIFVLYFTGFVGYSYYPVIKFNVTNIKTLIAALLYALLCGIPIFAKAKEVPEWKY